MGTVDISPSTEPQVSPGSRMAAPRLPEFMIGDFQMETSEGFNDYMYELGVNIVTRNIANNLYPLQKIRQAEDGVITLDTETSFRCTNTEFSLDETWQETTAARPAPSPSSRTTSSSRTRSLPRPPATTPPER